MARRFRFPHLGPAYFVRAALILAATAFLLWLSLATTIAQVDATKAPQRALAWWPVNAEANAALAQQRLGSESDPQRALSAAEAALPFTEAALRREPGNVAALRTWGLIASIQSDQSLAERLFRYAESLSRRDLATELWLIEYSVQQNDIPRALRHYDRALRTHRKIKDLLFPVLVQAAAEPEIGIALATLLREDPPYRDALASLIVSSTPAPASLPSFLRALGLNPADDVDRHLLVAAMNKLVEAGEYRAAYAMYRNATSKEDGLVRGGDFSAQPQLPPFDWVLLEQPNIFASIQPRPDGDGALYVSGDGARGEAARQLLMLPPGNYRLNAVVGDVHGDRLSRPQFKIHCAEGVNTREIGDLHFPEVLTGSAPVELRFAVPASGCTAQWLRVFVGAAIDGNAGNPWIDSIVIARQ